MDNNTINSDVDSVDSAYTSDTEIDDATTTFTNNNTSNLQYTKLQNQLTLVMREVQDLRTVVYEQRENKNSAGNLQKQTSTVATQTESEKVEDSEPINTNINNEEPLPSINIPQIPNPPLQTITISNSDEIKSQERVDENITNLNTTINIDRCEKLIKTLTADNVRNKDSRGYEITSHWFRNLEKLTHDPTVRKQLVLSKCDDVVLGMLELKSESKLNQSTYENIKINLLEITTKMDELDQLRLLHKFNWLGLEDPLIFASDLKRIYDLGTYVQTDYNHYLHQNITEHMLSDQADTWRCLFKSDPSQTLSTLARIYQEKGRTYFFGNDSPKIHKQKEQTNSESGYNIPYTIVNAPPMNYITYPCWNVYSSPIYARNLPNGLIRV